MKKIKIKKCMTSFLMLAVMVVLIIGVIPKNIVHAGINKDDFDGNSLSATTSVKDDFTDGSGKHINVEYIIKGSDDVFLIIVDNVYRLISKESFTVERIATTDDGSPYSDIYVTVSSDNCKHYDYYCANIQISNNQTLRTGYSTTYDKMKSLADSNPTKYDSIPNHFLGAFLYDVSIMEIFEEHKEGEPDGSSTNPIRDENVGYPDIYDYQFLIVKPKPLTGHFDNTDGDYDKLKNADYFKWKSKSTTGFSLTSPSDEYKDVYIQTKIVSKFKYNDKFNGKGEWHNYDNYGEVGYIPFVSASEKKLSVSFQQLTETLPKTFMETHNFKYQYQDYDYYFRIVYTRADDLKVIPTYYSGGWRRVSLHSNNGKHDENGEGDNSSAVIEDGDDDGGEWKKDEDSKDNDKNIDNGTTDGNDLDDAADNADNKNNSSSSGLNINNIKGFMNQVGNVPKAIGKLFTFLPDWVQQFIGFGFVVLVALMIIKAIRG